MSFQDGEYGFAYEMKALWQAIKGEGVVNGLQVTASLPSPDMYVHVSSGKCKVAGNTIEKTSTTDILLTADLNYPRKALIVVGSDGTISAVYGTAEEARPYGQRGRKTYTPKPPEIPSNSIVLAEVWIDANDTQIPNNDISDKRCFILETAGGYFTLEEWLVNMIDMAWAEGSSTKPTESAVNDADVGASLEWTVVSAGDYGAKDITFTLPWNFVSWKDADCIVYKVKGIALGSNQLKVSVIVFDSNGTQESVVKSYTFTGGASIVTISYNKTDLSGTYTAGGSVKIRIKAENISGTNNRMRAPRIVLNMKVS